MAPVNRAPTRNVQKTGKMPLKRGTFQYIRIVFFIYNEGCTFIRTQSLVGNLWCILWTKLTYPYTFTR